MHGKKHCAFNSLFQFTILFFVLFKSETKKGTARKLSIMMNAVIRADIKESNHI
jgi:hypothetical protein